MSKLALTAIVALVILLVGAGVVFAQGSTSFHGGGMRGGMMNSTAFPGTQATPGNGTYGPGMMENSNGNGIGMMGSGNWDEMRDAMKNGNWDEMVKVCKDTINSQATPQTSAPARNNMGTTGTGTTQTSGSGGSMMSGGGSMMGR